jgi:putative drug exporter of the RND superfamily
VGEVRRRQYERRVLHPGAQSQKAEDLLEERFPAQAGGTASVVFHAKSGTLTDPANQAAIEQTQANLAPGTAPHVTQVLGPTTPVVGQAFVSKNGTIGYVRVQYDGGANSVSASRIGFLCSSARSSDSRSSCS